MITALCVFVLCFCGHLVTASWTQAHRNQILKIHNDYRKGVPGACGMNMLKYDRQLENEAKAWAKRCVFEHQKKGRGENLAWITKYGEESSLIQQMAKMWYDEVKDFTYGAQTCGAACHYTQVVWSDTLKVGCYAEACSRLQQGGSNAYYLVCFYTPPGNYYGQNPYKKQCGNESGNKNSNSGSSNKSKNNNNNNNNSGSNNGVITSNNNNNNNNGWEPWPPSNNGGWKVVKTAKNNNGGWTIWKTRSSNGGDWNSW